VKGSDHNSSTVTPLKFVSKERIENEAKIGGTVLAPGAALPALAPNEKYVYVQTSDGRTAIMPQYLAGAANDGFIGNHPALLARIKEDAKAKGIDSFEIVGAGEIETRNGAIFEVNNGAGSMRGTKENLDYSLQDLESRGLARGPHTYVRDVSANEAEQSHPMRKENLQKRRDQIPDALRNRYEQILLKLQKRFPAKTHPWEIGEEMFDPVLGILEKDYGEEAAFEVMGNVLRSGDNIDSIILGVGDIKTFELNLQRLENAERQL